MVNLSTFSDRTREVLRYYAKGIFAHLRQKEVFLWAQAISFKVLITLVPVVILLTGIAGYLLRGDAFERISRVIAEYLPSAEMSSQLIQFLATLQRAGTFFTTLGIVALLFSAITLFTTLRTVIASIFQEEWHHRRTILGGYLFDMRMVAQVGLLFLLTFGATIITQWLDQGGLAFARSIGLDYVWLTIGWKRSFRFLTLVIPYLLSTAMFFQLFYFVPKPSPPKRSAILGAVITGLLWEVAKRGFAFYATYASRFDRYSVSTQEGDPYMGALGDAFGLIIAFVFWAYYSGLVLILGGIITLLHETRHRAQRMKHEEAVPEGAASETVTPEAAPPKAPPQTQLEPTKRDVTLP